MLPGKGQPRTPPPFYPSPFGSRTTFVYSTPCRPNHDPFRGALQYDPPPADEEFPGRFSRR
jgi:hypothetical protein